MNRVETLLEDLRLHRGALFPIVTRPIITRLRAMALASGRQGKTPSAYPHRQ